MLFCIFRSVQNCHCSSLSQLCDPHVERWNENNRFKRQTEGCCIYAFEKLLVCLVLWKWACVLRLFFAGFSCVVCSREPLGTFVWHLAHSSLLYPFLHTPSCGWWAVCSIALFFMRSLLDWSAELLSYRKGHGHLSVPSPRLCHAHKSLQKQPFQMYQRANLLSFLMLQIQTAEWEFCVFFILPHRTWTCWCPCFVPASFWGCSERLLPVRRWA